MGRGTLPVSGHGLSVATIVIMKPVRAAPGWKRPAFYVLAAGIFLVLANSVVILWLARTDEFAVRQQTFGQAAVLGEIIVGAVRWNAAHGVFVEKDGSHSLGKDFDGVSIRGVNGKTYTTVSPGMMVREFSEHSGSTKGFAFHLASLRPNNSASAPDAWERGALTDFAKGVNEKSAIAVKDGKTSYRMMKPLRAEASCFGCHPGHGYKTGDVLGGISVDIPVDSPFFSEHRRQKMIAGVLLSFFVVLILSLYFIVWRLVNRLTRQAAVLEELSESKDLFLGMASHDLRNPLTVAIACARLLQESLQDKTQLEILNTIERSSVRMLGLVTALLDIAAINGGRLEFRPENVDVAALIHDSAHLNRILSRKYGVDIRVDAPPDIDGARLDPERIRQAIDNLVGNALKNSNPGTMITIGARKDAGRLEIWVADQGIGMTPEVLARVVDAKAMAVGHPVADDKDSHGLGLMIVKKMVELHGGSFHISSRTGEGTKIVLSFPLAAAGQA